MSKKASEKTGKAARKAGHAKTPKPPKVHRGGQHEPAPVSGAKPPVAPTGQTILTTGPQAGPAVSADAPSERAARANMPVGLRSRAERAEIDRKAKKKSGKKAKGGKTGLGALIHRGFEILRKMSGHSKSSEYKQFEKDILGDGWATTCD